MIAKSQVKHVVVASMGDLFGLLKGTVVNFVVRNVKKMVPAYTLPDAVRFNAALAEGARMQLTPSAAGPDDPAFLQYTGGTTGVSKGATLLHRNIVANVLQSEAWMQPALNNPKKPPPPEQSVIVCALPLYHIFALTVCCLLGMRTGAKNILIPNPRDLPAVVEALKPYKITLFPAVNTLYNVLADNEAFRKLDFSELRVSQRRRHGRAEGGCRQVAEAHRLPDLRRLRPVRDLAVGHLQPHRHRRVQRHDRAAAAVDRSRDHRRRRQAGAARPARRDRDPRPAGHGRLLAASGGHGRR